MTPLDFLLVVFTESCSVAGQVFFKHAMSGADARQAGNITAGVALKTVSFFLWLGLLSKYQLSFLYPFEGMDRIIMVAATTIFLKEKMTPSLWVGVSLISAGILLVSRS